MYVQVRQMQPSIACNQCGRISGLLHRSTMSRLGQECLQDVLIVREARCGHTDVCQARGLTMSLRLYSIEAYIGKPQLIFMFCDSYK